MTPKEHASKLSQDITDALIDAGCSINKQGVVACAKICVDEIVSAHPSLFKSDGEILYTPKMYWQQVKEEIDKL